MKIRRTLLCTAAASLLTAMSWSASAQNLVMKAADVHPAGYPTVAAVESMGKKIEAATQGRIKFQMFPGSVLGGEKEMIEQTQVGAIHLSTSLVADVQLLIAACVWGWSVHVTGEGFTPAVTASVVSLASGALFANVVSVLILIGETLTLRR